MTTTVDDTPLCTTVEPVGKDAMCQRDDGHPMPHRAVYSVDGGIVAVEWIDASLIRTRLRQARLLR